MPTTRPRTRAQAGRRSPQDPAARRHDARKRNRLFRWKLRLIVAAFVLVLGLCAWAVLARRLVPTSNTPLTHFDAIIVLGTPTDEDGNPTPTQLARVTEAVREYERGVAPRIIVTGGVDRRRPVEARVMARTAKAEGIPASAILEEGEARNTIENGCYSVRIMQRHGWHSAEVVSSASHLPRAGLIFSRLPLEWRTHAAPPLEPPSAVTSGAETAMETLKTIRYLVWARQMDSCQP